MEGVVRRLAAILCADVVGFSGLVERDEPATLRALKAHRRELIDPVITSRGGRIFKSTGDGLLAEFGSVVDAMGAALAIQKGMAKRNALAPAEDQMLFRLGLNLGDVVIEDGDVLGHGVNVAARLQALAEPGGICVSGTVVDQVMGKAMGVSVEPLGEVKVKSIDRPVTAFRIRPADRALVDVAPTAIDISPAAVLGRAALRDPPALSLVVLPFANQGGEEDWLADGITEDLIGGLGRLHGFFVIARGSAFTFKGQNVDPRTVGRDLGVRYVLEGRVRRRDDKLRLAAELIEAATGQSLWTQTFDRDRADLDLVQEEITAQIANALRYELIGREGERARRKDPAEVVADDLVMQGWAEYHKSTSREQQEAALTLFEQAARLEPKLAAGWLGVATARASLVINSFVDDAAAELAHCHEDLATARRLVRGDSLELAIAEGLLCRVTGRSEEACRAFERAIRIDANDARAHLMLGAAYREAGRPADFFMHFFEAIRRSPNDPMLGLWFSLAAISAFHLGQLEDGLEWSRKAISVSPDLHIPYFSAASELALAGRVEEARKWLVRLPASSPIRSVKDFSEKVVQRHAPALEAQIARRIQGLRLAGLAEE